MIKKVVLAVDLIKVDKIKTLMLSSSNRIWQNKMKMIKKEEILKRRENLKKI